MSEEREDLPLYGRDFIATDAERERLKGVREEFDRSTPWKVDDIEITGEASLIAALMTRSARDLAWTRNCIEDSLRQDVLRFVEWREVIMKGITELCEAPSSPNPIHILRLLYMDVHSLDMISERYQQEVSGS